MSTPPTLPRPHEFRPYLHPVPFRYRIGATALDMSDWILIDDEWQADLAEKRSLLDEHHNVIVKHLDPESVAEAAEVLTALSVHLAGRFPELYRLDGRRIVNLGTDESWSLDDAGIHPIEVAGRLVQEDMTLLGQRGGELVMTCASVAFPNRWDLASKIGRNMASIHSPVPTVNGALGASIDSFISRLMPGRPYSRFAWGICEHEQHFQPSSLAATMPQRGPITPDNAGSVLFRMERETLQRFARHGSVLFTFRTYRRPLAWFRDRVEDAHQLAAALRTMPPDIADYKGIGSSGAVLADWLEAT